RHYLCVILLFPHTMNRMLNFTEISREIEQAENLPHAVSGIIHRIRLITKQQRQSLLNEALTMHTVIGGTNEQWDPRRTTIGVILHSVGVQIIESDEQRLISESIRDDLMKNDAGPMSWIQPRETNLP